MLAYINKDVYILLEHVKRYLQYINKCPRKIRKGKKKFFSNKYLRRNAFLNNY